MSYGRTGAGRACGSAPAAPIRPVAASGSARPVTPQECGNGERCTRESRPVCGIVERGTSVIDLLVINKPATLFFLFIVKILNLLLFTYA
jgi:hypothetical protein